MWFVVHWVRQKTTFNIIIFSGRGGGFKRYGIMKTIGESNSTAKEILTPWNLKLQILEKNLYEIMKYIKSVASVGWLSRVFISADSLVAHLVGGRFCTAGTRRSRRTKNAWLGEGAHMTKPGWSKPHTHSPPN